MNSSAAIISIEGETKTEPVLIPEPAKTVVHLHQADIFQGKHLVLHNVHLSIEKGAFTYLIGKTGTGKSSLLQTLYAALPLQKGEGQVADFDLKKLKKRKKHLLRRRLGMVFQDFRLLDDRNTEENLIFVLKATGWKDEAKRKHRVDEVLRAVGMQFMKHKMPHTLSGGEKQRLGIARALLNYPDLLIADEPTGNLDPDTSNEILQLFSDLNKEKQTTILLATHDYRLIDEFPAQVMRTQQGRLFT